MTKASIDALRAEVGRASVLFASLRAEEWALPSGCSGWRVQDVATHMASTFHQIADPSTIDAGASHDAEENAEVPVRARKAWTPEEVLAEYAEWSARGVDALAAMQEPGLAEVVIPLGNLGSHPMHILGNAIVFDHYCHLRHDIGAAVARAADLPRDPAALGAAIEWMLAGLPQMCADALAACTVGVNLTFADLGTTWAVAPGTDGWTTREGAVDGLATVTTTAHDFVSWGTKRADWRAMGVVVDGAVAATLDACNVI